VGRRCKDVQADQRTTHYPPILYRCYTDTRDQGTHADGDEAPSLHFSLTFPYADYRRVGECLLSSRMQYGPTKSHASSVTSLGYTWRSILPASHHRDKSV